MNNSEGAKCTGKIRHATRADAEGQMVSLKKAFGDRELEVYTCNFCSGWHVGHTRTKTKRRRKGGHYSK